MTNSDLKPLIALESRLLQLEERLCFLRQLTPLNFEFELNRLSEQHERALNVNLDLNFKPAFRYARLLNLDRIDQEFEQARLDLKDFSHKASAKPDAELGLLVANELGLRLKELALQVSVLRARGDASLCNKVAQELYYFSKEALTEAHAVAKQWLALPDSTGEPEKEVDLASTLAEIATQRGQRVVIETPEIASVAAVGAGRLLVRRGAQVTPHQARRIYEHEVEGHLLMRQRSQSQLPPFRIGSQGADCDEEGRAIWLEEQAGYLDNSRKKQLAGRFVAAQALRKLPDISSVYRSLRRSGVKHISPRDVLRLFRGGALGREVIYLPAYLRIKRKFAHEQQLAQLMSLGRLSCASAERLLSLCQRS